MISDEPVEALVARFDAVGDEIWRQYVDLDNQAFGPLTYDRGHNNGTVEPGYLAAMARGHRFLRERLGQPLTREVYEALVPACMPKRPALLYRVEHAWLHVHRDRMEEGIHDVWRTHGVTPDETAKGVAPAKLRIRFVHIPPEALAARVDEAIATLHASLEGAADRDARVLAIATFHQSLELLHPTNDGNTRRHALVLDKLLVEAGETPTILTEINDVYVRRPASWARMITEGMRRHAVVRDAIAHGEDVEEAMQAFDAQGVLGQRGARRLGANRTYFPDVVHVSFVGPAVPDEAVADPGEVDLLPAPDQVATPSQSSGRHSELEELELELDEEHDTLPRPDE